MFKGTAPGKNLHMSQKEIAVSATNIDYGRVANTFVGQSSNRVCKSFHDVWCFRGQALRLLCTWVQIPVHCGQSFRRIADSIPVIADSFS
jgi:hypothetical protein